MHCQRGKTKSPLPWDFVTPPENDQATAIGNMQKTFGKDRACGSRDMFADRQTDTQTHTPTRSLLRHRSGSNNVIMSQNSVIIIPILLYALEVCNLDKRSLHSLNFTVNRFFMKLFQTSTIEIVHYCQNMSSLQLPSVFLGSRYQKFRSNMPCHVYSWVVVVVSFFFVAFFATLWWIKMNIYRVFWSAHL